ncbi:hypothetical protein GSH19_02380 [Lactobacillus sp. S2-2]|uniref:hypothetical protein n=1 Tax=Lactobacillus sp. S2-2 TaxID=2692917 RepID=UPI001F330D92|nr:hypothetical protein [Lactobacillus sp. S2-2]MCF6515011.1 hypothetical protein [Lactobacillus sp. S2-2]
MLFKYRSDYEKIAMGLFSLLKDSEDAKYLNQEMKWYESSDNRKIYLWKDKYDNWSCLVGIEEQDELVVIRRVIFTPDSENDNSLFEMMDELKDLYPRQKIIGTFDTTRLIEKWKKNLK